MQITNTNCEKNNNNKPVIITIYRIESPWMYAGYAFELHEAHTAVCILNRIKTQRIGNLIMQNNATPS